MFRSIQNTALNPYFQALIIALALILLIPGGIQKYYARQVDMITDYDALKFFYADLDHDGYSQQILTFYNEANNVGVAIKTNDNPYEQFNFKGIYNDLSPRFVIGDYDGDHLDEVYLFTLDDDSVLLQALEYGPVQHYFVKNRFLTRIGKNLKDPDYMLFPGKITDMTGDGFGDLVFAISAGFSLYPRNVFIYDIKNDSLRMSPQSGAFINNMMLSNLDDDPYLEIALNTTATDNYNNIPVPYPDSSCWLMVLDHDLQFMFPPVEFPGPIGDVTSYPMNSAMASEPLLMCVVKYIIQDEWKGEIFIIDHKGTVLKSTDLQHENTSVTINLAPSFKGSNARGMLAIDPSSGFYTIDGDLDIKLIKEMDVSKKPPEFIDIDQEGLDEILVLSPDQARYIIYRNDFSHPVEIDFPIQQRRPLLSVKLDGENPPRLSVQGDQVWKLFDYGINPFWRFRFLIWIGIYLSILSFIMIIRKLYSFQLKKRYETEKKIATLQLSSVKAQMEPHFIMNTINTIGSSIYRQKPDEAYQLLVNFSGMVRSLLKSSDQLTRSYKEEIEFVKNYLELEKSRFHDVFDFTVHEDEGIDQKTIIPKMIIQLHAENALKHGLLPKEHGGKLDIFVRKEEEYLIITIRDNGIGRNMAARKMSESTGKGMKILAQLFETYNKQNKVPLKHEINDLFDDEGNPAGTMVNIYVPLDFNKEIF